MSQIYNFKILGVPPKKPPVVSNPMVINSAKTNPPITSKPTPVVSTSSSLPTTNGNISSNLFKINYGYDDSVKNLYFIFIKVKSCYLFQNNWFETFKKIFY